MHGAVRPRREARRIDPAQVKTVRVTLSQTACSTCTASFARLQGEVRGADLSAHYVAAAILHDRALTLAQFEPARYDDAETSPASPSNA